MYECTLKLSISILHLKINFYFFSRKIQLVHDKSLICYLYMNVKNVIHHSMADAMFDSTLRTIMSVSYLCEKYFHTNYNV